MKHSLADPVAMWHVKDQIAPSVLLVVDFGGWYRLDSKASNDSSTEMIHHTQVSLLKDVIVPYTHLLPRLHVSENKKRHTLLYFKGAKHRHRVSILLPASLAKCNNLFQDVLTTNILYYELLGADY